MQSFFFVLLLLLQDYLQPGIKIKRTSSLASCSTTKFKRDQNSTNPS